MDELPECKRKRVDNDGDPSVRRSKAGEAVVDPDGEYLWHFTWGLRGGVLEGLFFATLDQMTRARKANKKVYFGEALGKHSEVEVRFKDLGVTLATNRPELIAAQREIFAGIGCKCMGYNPIEILDEMEEDEESEASEDDDSDSSEEEESESEPVQCEEPPPSTARVLIGLCKDVGLI